MIIKKYVKILKIVLIKNQVTLGKNENEILGDILYFISQIFFADRRAEMKINNN